jgi:long-chain acyl-CoA synthetase
MVGYYKQPELTAECFTEDGFFRTGDLGELGAGGLLKITGRAKELFKTAKGKYVAPAPLENRLNAHPDGGVVDGGGRGPAGGLSRLVLLAETCAHGWMTPQCAPKCTRPWKPCCGT